MFTEQIFYSKDFTPDKFGRWQQVVRFNNLHLGTISKNKEISNEIGYEFRSESISLSKVNYSSSGFDLGTYKTHDKALKRIQNHILIIRNRILKINPKNIKVKGLGLVECPFVVGNITEMNNYMPEKIYVRFNFPILNMQGIVPYSEFYFKIVSNFDEAEEFLKEKLKELQRIIK